MTAHSIDLLRQMPIFGGLSESSLELILAKSTLQVIAKSEYLFREGDPADSLFVLKSGRVLVQKQHDDQSITLGELGEGDCLGEMALIDFQQRSASILAIEDCEAIEISSSGLRELMKTDLMQYTMIMMNMGREVSRRLRIADQRILELQTQKRPES
ncbi:MAG: cyclic nucleotide-binding domain-containing protein [Pirellulaceae bacterium]